MKEKGYELYAAAGGNKFLLQREGLLEEYEKLGISREQEDRWSREVRRGAVCRAEYKRIERGTYDESSNIYNRYGHL